MEIKDKIYGKFEIENPCLIELINSKSLQRLKKICQYGVPNRFYHLKNYSRFDHSLGVFLILRKLGATDEEQIAGLTHDISHTAFSHIIDWVMGDGREENHQDLKHEDFLLNSDLFKILEKHHYNPRKIANHTRYTLLEQDIPNLCADRIDYSLKEFPLITARYCFGQMTTRQGVIIFKDYESALVFARNFLNKQQEHWGGFEAVSRYRLFANVLRTALDKKIITLNDFWEDDKFVLNKIEQAKEASIKRLLAVLRQKSLSNLTKGKELAYKKFRYVDPEFLSNNQVFRLSKSSPEFKNEIKKARALNRKGVLIPRV